jgi:hypothetical protein
MSPAWRYCAWAILAANLVLTVWVLWQLFSGQLEERLFVDSQTVSAFPTQPAGAAGGGAALDQGLPQPPPSAGDVPPPPPRQDLLQQAPPSMDRPPPPRQDLPQQAPR